jgi:hypothetical protein
MLIVLLLVLILMALMARMAFIVVSDRKTRQRIEGLRGHALRKAREAVSGAIIKRYNRQLAIKRYNLQMAATQYALRKARNAVKRYNRLNSQKKRQ